ncbi:zinc ABC transporter substrate-binding protein [Pseudomonas sp. Choline-3u-10]|uniref:zinc ABC transporter substrate-binding protein n=1 Tax=Pseudomonadaceae TaxID=135621 RepID=UPI000618089E|nr:MULTISPECIES: zinc ABC transporter substrate-binding protein [unclassified Pseudomonas]MAL34705.1 zinc ABC transporter substrate-binding protein [Pseudomonas sp.]MBK3794343.1 zinc ABC transporter substrate-binding protein [Stutzerimonas stutzeri]MBU0950931.1 zinc ABC transporter substrate-binding protein [Gammaproteobacteria bacterium]KJJ62347.1 ABC transporter substrate-binding protein [Pseudomonas sp. 10B238]MBK3875833.1 zinc ABC transporter substrate-binding protein [Stutzerimonas stutze
MFRLFSIPLLVTASLFSSAQAHAEIEVLTSIKPLQLIAAAVQDGVGKPAVLLPPGASPHHYAMRPSDVRQIRSADLFYWIGPDMEGFLAPVLEGRKRPSVAIQSLPGLTLRHFGDAAGEHEAEHDRHDEHAHEAHGEHSDQAHDEHDDHAHEAAADHEEHDHAHRPGSLDAHLWLLPANAVTIAEGMAQDMAKADPANAERYRANLAAFKQRLDALDKRLSQRLSETRTKPFFVFHEAFDYFEAAYGIKHAGVFSAGGEAQPGARHVAAMRERLEQAGPSCVFYEPPVRPRLADSLIRGLPVKVTELDALGHGIDASAGGYEQLIDNLGRSLAECLESL